MLQSGSYRDPYILGILGKEHVFKIKKPIRYSFLDFSTLEKRKYYCEQEVVLNRRLVSGIYLGIIPVCRHNEQFIVSENLKRGIVDYAVMMKRIDGRKQMDVMLRNGEVTESHMASIAQILTDFHKQTDIVYNKDHFGVQHNFDDIITERDYLRRQLGMNAGYIIEDALKRSDDFIASHGHVIKRRARQGYVRDCHGDLHSRNIFLCKEPIIFDCIEFNTDIRQIDILNELAFFCMDLEAFGYDNLSSAFIIRYNSLFEVMHSGEDERLFIYYKAYRANVRAKVNALRAKDASGKYLKKTLTECDKYLQLMHGYMNMLN